MTTGVRTRGLVRAWLATCLLLTAGYSRAQAQVALDAFRPLPVASDGFALGRPEVLARGVLNVQANVDYANDPLVIKLERARTRLSVVHNHLVVHAGAALGLGARTMLFVSLPVHAWMAGTEPREFGPRADGAGLGDLTLGGRVLLLGSPEARGMLSGELIARLPTAEWSDAKQAYSGDAIGSYEPALIGELTFSRLAVRARVGGRFRKRREIGDLSLGQEVVYGAGGRVRLVAGLHAHVELYGSYFAGNGSQAELNPLELLLGAKWQAADWNIGAAAGPGLVRGYGSPDVRGIASLAYAPIAKPKAAPIDTDRDGLVDGRDACPQEPEDRDGQEDGDGCPDLDPVSDPVPDLVDPCSPTGSSVAGCPQPDQDGDSLADSEDKCPSEAGPIEAAGCPTVHIDPHTQQLTLPSGIEFATNRAEILSQSTAALEQLEAALAAHAQIEHMRIEGHTDDVGKDAANLDLSRRRAKSVALWLIQHGVAAQRLEAWGCGETRPLIPNDSAEHRQVNRRVEFHILQEAASGVGATETCAPTSLAP